MEDTAAAAEIEYYSETFARMSVAYAAAHAEEPAAPGPAYVSTVDDGDAPLPISLTERLSLSQTEFEAWVHTAVKEQIAAEAAERYISEETEGFKSYSVVNGDHAWGSNELRIWSAVEDDSVNFFHGGKDIGVSGLGAVFDEDGFLDQARMNEAVEERIAAPPGGYERVYEKGGELNRIICAYVKAHPEGPSEEHYRKIIDEVKMAAAEEAAEVERSRLTIDLANRLTIDEMVEDREKKYKNVRPTYIRFLG
jgi:hypothetical protein